MKIFTAATSLIIVFSFLPGQSNAAAQVQIKIATTDEANIIRRDISPRTFGSGIQFNTSQLRWTMDHLDEPNDTTPPVSSITSDTINWLKLGMLRFPTGDSSFAYIAENPQASYLPCNKDANGNVIAPCPIPHDGQWSSYLTPNEIVRYTDTSRPTGLGMERLLEVNTVMWLKTDPWKFHYINCHIFYPGLTAEPGPSCSTPTQPPNAPLIDTSALSVAADKAAEWVARDTNNGNTLFWEIGNEDWSRWNGEQYGQIFDTFQTKMKQARPTSEIKVLAQGLAENFKTDVVNNTPVSWLSGLKAKLSATGNLNKVYGYAIHQYVAPSAAASQPQQKVSDMLAIVAKGAAVDNAKRLLAGDSATRNWKLWMTEFNVAPNQAKQDMGHALVIADWTGKMLEQNVERMLMHTLSHDPCCALVQYANDGATIETPRVSVPGYAFAMYAQGFGKTMVKNTIEGTNPMLTAPNPDSKSYPQIAVYSSISEDNMSLRVMVINRHMTERATVGLDTQNVQWRRKLANTQYMVQKLQSSNITDTNMYTKDVVKWTEPAFYPQQESGITGVSIAPASVNFFNISLQQP